MKITGNEPAHQLDGMYAAEQRREGYLTIRQHFAAMAMQGILSTCDFDGSYINPKDIAILSVEHADALIAELNKESEVSNG